MKVRRSVRYLDMITRDKAAECPNAVPVLNLDIVREDFSHENWLLDCGYAELHDYFTVKPGFFVAQVKGEELNRR